MHLVAGDKLQVTLNAVRMSPLVPLPWNIRAGGPLVRMQPNASPHLGMLPRTSGPFIGRILHAQHCVRLCTHNPVTHF